MIANFIIQGDACEVLKTFTDSSINCCVTSPPYWGLRDYGVDGQLGLEKTPEEYVEKMVEIFREVKRVLKNDGTLWLNLGDSYSTDSGGYFKSKNEPSGAINQIKFKQNLRPKNLVGIPWRVAFALQADGWWLRQDIIWSKPNPMPESIKDRCTKSHEYIFLFSKSKKYYFDYESIQEPIVCCENRPSGVYRHKNYNYNSKYNDTGLNADLKKNHKNSQDKVKGNSPGQDKRNKRSVWTVPTQGYKEAHFATFPEKLIIDCIKAGCSINGIVLDPFMGAGTTALVARKLNRNFIGIELNPEYIEIANNRLKEEIPLFIGENK